MAIAKLNKRRATAGIAAATLLTMSLISGTLARYTSTGNSWDKARVAKWGIQITTSGSLYGDAYKAKEDNGIGNWVSARTDIDGLTVRMEDKDIKGVAPGTKNDKGAKFAISGTSEVDAEVTMTEASGFDIYLNSPAAGTSYNRAVRMVDAVDGAEIKDKVDEEKVVYAVNRTNRAVEAKFTLSNVNSSTFDLANYDYYLHNTDEEAKAEDFKEGSSQMTYYPVVYTLFDGEGDVTKPSTHLKDLATVENLGATFINKPFKAGSVIEGEGYGIKWKWAIRQTVTNVEIEEDATDDEAAGNMDEADTLLGDLIADGTGNNDVIWIYDQNASGCTILKADGNSHIINGSEVIGSLKTGFTAEIKAHQVD